MHRSVSVLLWRWTASFNGSSSLWRSWGRREISAKASGALQRAKAWWLEEAAGSSCVVMFVREERRGLAAQLGARWGWQRPSLGRRERARFGGSAYGGGGK